MKFLAALAFAALAFMPATVADAERSGDISGTIAVASVSTWNQPVTYAVSTSPDVHTPTGGRSTVDQLYITHVCSQDGQIVFVASFGVGGTGQWSDVLDQRSGLASQGIAIDLSRPGSCEAWLIHTNIKGKNHTIDKLDGVTFTVNGA